MKNRSFKRNIALKVSLFVGIFILLLQVISGFLSVQSGQSLISSVQENYRGMIQENVKNREQESMEQLKDLITFNAKMLSSIVTPVIYNLEDPIPALSSFMEIEHIQAIAAYDDSDSPVGAVWREDSVSRGADLPGTFAAGDHQEYSTDLTNEGERIGSVRIYYSDKKIIADSERNRSVAFGQLKEQQKIIQADLNSTIRLQILGLAVLVAVFLIVIFVLISTILKPLKTLAAAIRNVEETGQFDQRVEVKGMDEIGQTATAYNLLMESLQSALSEIIEVVNGLSRGDLSYRVEQDHKGDLDELGNNINQALEMLSETILKVVDSATNVNSGSLEMANSAQTLAKGTSDQAASLEEATSSMSEVESQTRTNNENAMKAQELSGKTLEVVSNGTAQMNDMLAAMNSIDTTSGDVTKIIKVIDEIAFQTNLLALNAAVEAARAGKYGKGFSVVAEEVRNLAARSGEAARNTTELIEKSTKQVANGVSNAQSTAEILNEISDSVEKVNLTVGEITEASNLQTTGIEEINKGLNQINQVVQQNSAISEETASASNQLSSQATGMKEMMEKFVVRKWSGDIDQNPQEVAIEHRSHPPLLTD